MRLIPLLALAVVVIGGVGIFAFNAFGLRDKIFAKAQHGQEAIQGFSAAKSPAEAMDLFRKAIKERRYKTAAKYVTGTYGPQLALAQDAGAALGEVLDNIRNFTTNKGFVSDRTTLFLALLDPFPGNFIVQGAPRQDKDTAKGAYLYETLLLSAPIDLQKDFPSLDGRMFSNNLHPYGGPNLSFPVDLVAEGTGDAKQWKLRIDIPDFRVQSIGYFKDHYRSYVTGMEKFMGEANNQRYGSKAEYERELIKVFMDAK